MTAGRDDDEGHHKTGDEEPVDDGTEAWQRLDRGTNVPGVIAGDISQWLGTLDESAVAQVLEVYLPSEAETFSMVDVAAQSGIDIERLQLFWRALGFPRLDDDAAQLNANDVELLTTFASFFVERTREQGVGLQMARILGSNLDRVASAQVDSLVARVLLAGPAVDVAAERSKQFSELMPRLLELIWRRHLANATRRRLLRPTVGDTATVCVGFADMVGFTATAQKLNQLELARIVGWFEAEAYEVVSAGGGRVVKTIGDEVMFVAEDLRSGAAIAVDLAERFRDDTTFPNVHVGLAAGPVIQRRGDVYGPTVNLAARIVSVALPGSVLITEDIYEVIADDPEFDVRASFEHDLDDIGRVTLWRVRRPGTIGVASRALLAAEDTWRQRGVRTWEAYPTEVTERIRAHLEASSDPAAGRLLRVLGVDRGGEPIEGAETELGGSDLDVLAEAILAVDLDPDLQVDLLADLYAARELRRMSGEADRRVAQTDDEAVERLRRIEDETVRRITAAQTESRQKVAAALRYARESTNEVDASAQGRVRELIDRARQEDERVRAEARTRAVEVVEQARRRR